MAEKDTAEATSATPPQEPLTVSGGAAQLLDRFPEESATKPDPEPKDTEDSATEIPEVEDAGGLKDEPDEPVVETPPLHKVKVDGVEQEITLDEALRGYSRTADYKNKTMRLADERRSVEAEVQAARRARDAYAEKLTLVDQALADEPTPDWDKVRQETPEDFPTLMAEWQLRRDEHQKVKAERKRVTDEQATEVAQRQRVYLDGEAELLQAAIPELGQPEKAGKFKTDLFTYGETQGFSRAELGSVADHRALVILNKARRYDAIVARKTETTKVVTPTVAPGGRPPSAKGTKQKKAKKEAQDRLQRTGRMDDAVEALMHMD